MKKEMENIVEAEKAVKVIRELISKTEDLQIKEHESKTGFSYFAGKKRLCKLLKTKRGIRLEINVELPDKFANMPEMENISYEKAHRLHLGTMKHLYRAADSRHIKSIIAEALKSFRKEIEIKEKSKEA